MDPKEWEVGLVRDVVFLMASTKLTPPLASDEVVLRQAISPLEVSPVVASLLFFFFFFCLFFSLAGEDLPELLKIASSLRLYLRARLRMDEVTLTRDKLKGIEICLCSSSKETTKGKEGKNPSWYVYFPHLFMFFPHLGMFSYQDVYKIITQNKITQVYFPHLGMFSYLQEANFKRNLREKGKEGKHPFRL